MTLKRMTPLFPELMNNNQEGVEPHEHPPPLTLRNVDKAQSSVAHCTALDATGKGDFSDFL